MPLYKIDPGSERNTEFFDAKDDEAALVKAKTHSKDFAIKPVSKGKQEGNATLVGESPKNKLWKVKMMTASEKRKIIAALKS
jgi:hypothetical protein